jgi:hypothetical protein
MIPLVKRILWPVIFVSAIVAIFTADCFGGVFIFDQVTTLNTDVFLKVQTKGRFFAEGGKRVDVYVNHEKIKRILTGGDGYGYYRYKPQQLGLIPIEARSEGYRDTGVLLVADKDDKFILIDVDTGLKESPLSGRARRYSLEVVSDLAGEYKLIYLNTLLGSIFFEGWLVKEKFPESAVLKWQGTAMLHSLQKRGIHLHAIVGSAGMMSEAKKHIQNRYTFEKSEDGRTVKDWEEIMEFIQKESK